MEQLDSEIVHLLVYSKLACGILSLHMCNIHVLFKLWLVCSIYRMGEILEWENLVNLANRMTFINFYLPITFLQSVVAIHAALHQYFTPPEFSHV